MAKRPPEIKRAKQILLPSPDLTKFPVSENIPPRLLALAERLQELLASHFEQVCADGRKTRRKKEQ
ncbi:MULTISPECIES: hypothetical protein [unclassified Mesorhizobium]|uniref:hypothetical protein n=1 Tax=unclassified Mesorhizobium TaxID=325217 RepID=UPI003336DA7C